MIARTRERITRAALMVLLLSAASTAGAQSPADGWSGQVQCVLAARGPGYQDDQTHTWVLSGAPKVQNDFRDYTATWTVSGSGSRRPISARAVLSSLPEPTSSSTYKR
jgi:hypothetical protein